MLWNYKEKKPFIKNRNYIKYTQNPVSDAFFRWFHWKFKSKWAQLKLIVPSFLTSMIYTAIYQECTLYYKLFFLSFIILNFHLNLHPGVCLYIGRLNSVIVTWIEFRTHFPQEENAKQKVDLRPLTSFSEGQPHYVFFE